jgi:hypothetical protein
VLAVAAVVSTGCGNNGSVTANVSKVSGDAGDPRAVAAVRESVLPLLTARCRLERTETPLVDAASRAAAAQAVDQRVVAEVSRVYAASLVDSTVAGIRSDMKALLPDPNYPAFPDCRLALDRWDGVHVRGDSATVSVEAATSTPARHSPTGDSSNVSADGWASEGARLIDIRLVKEQGNWRLLQVTTLMPDGTSPLG